MIDLSVIVVSYNTNKILFDCLSTIFSNKDGISIEVIVVDNASSDGSPDMVKKEFPGVRLIQNTQNQGFAKANNQGIKISIGRFILLLNSDTLITDNAFKKMVEWMDTHKEVGVATCCLKNEDGSVQPTGGFFPNLPRLLLWQLFIDDLIPISPYHPKLGFYNKERELDWVTGAFFMMNREIIKNIGLMDENFFMYAEELEYCYRIKKSGVKIYYTPQVSVIHLGFKSSSKEKAILGEYRSLKYFYSKYYTKIEQFFASLILKTGALLRFALKGILRHNVSLINTYGKCFKEA